MSRTKFKHLLEKFVTLGGHANARTAQFLRYTVTASSTFVLDLTLLWVLTQFFGIYYLVSAALAFSIAISINYVTCRNYAFGGSSRNYVGGYIRFIGIALAGVVMVVLSMRTLVESFAIPYLLARIIVGTFIGMWNYTMNAFWNFRR